jgi:hypothetical protein
MIRPTGFREADEIFKSEGLLRMKRSPGRKFGTQSKGHLRASSSAQPTQRDRHDLKLFVKKKKNLFQVYSVFHQFRQAKFDNVGSILSSNQFSPLPSGL